MGSTCESTEFSLELDAAAAVASVALVAATEGTSPFTVLAAIQFAMPSLHTRSLGWSFPDAASSQRRDVLTGPSCWPPFE